MLTALDQVANQNHLQLLKALIPYVPPGNQKTLSVCIKMMEMQNVLRFFNQEKQCVSACSSSSGSPGILDILADVRNYCEEGEQEMIDQCIQMLSALELYSIFAQSQGENPAEGTMNSEENYE